MVWDMMFWTPLGMQGTFVFTLEHYASLGYSKGHIPHHGGQQLLNVTLVELLYKCTVQVKAKLRKIAQ